MVNHSLVISILTATLFLSTGLATSAEPQQIYGYQLMTQQEMFEFHQRLRNARTPQERAQIRNENHQKMQTRAEAQGFTLPNTPSTNAPCRHMDSGCMGTGYMRPGYMGPRYMGPGHMGPGYMGPGHMWPGGYRNP